ncbi:MAG: hypothetical protein K2J20_02010, partial [Bacilli bacterium]|nr:hypothetical protein [Bacilli bacterium]
MMSDAITLYDNGRTKEEIDAKLKLDSDKIKLEIKQDEEYVEFILAKELDIITPGLNFVFDNPYNLKVSRSIQNDS